MASIKLQNFGDIISVVENRAKIKGDTQTADRDFVKGVINETYISIATERNWYWRSFDRSFKFAQAVTTGTVSVTINSRAVVFTGLTLSNIYIGRSFKVDGKESLYRIVGIDTGSNTAYLDSLYIDSTNATATYKIFQYEFPLPPDCDVIRQLYFDYGVGSENRFGEIEPVNNLQFNRMLAENIDYQSIPVAYTRDGKIRNSNLNVLDQFILDYDFLAGDQFEQVDKLRIFPIEPDNTKVIHLNYSIHVDAMEDDDEKPIIPVDNRWVLVHFALYEWHKRNGNGTMADREFRDANRLLKEMRAEHHKTDVKPKMIVQKSKLLRRRGQRDRKDIFYISRQAEY